MPKSNTVNRMTTRQDREAQTTADTQGADKGKVEGIEQQIDSSSAATSIPPAANCIPTRQQGGERICLHR